MAPNEDQEQDERLEHHEFWRGDEFGLCEGLLKRKPVLCDELQPVNSKVDLYLEKYISLYLIQARIAVLTSFGSIDVMAAK